MNRDSNSPLNHTDHINRKKTSVNWAAGLVLDKCLPTLRCSTPSLPVWYPTKVLSNFLFVEVARKVKRFFVKIENPNGIYVTRDTRSASP